LNEFYINASLSGLSLTKILGLNNATQSHP
jgi:hypothetical protein